MHVDPKSGVVDENCRIHGLTNVYVAGGSVFSTGIGYANPTLTLMALTGRLAGHLKGRLGVTGGQAGTNSTPANATASSRSGALTIA